MFMARFRIRCVLLLTFMIAKALVYGQIENQLDSMASIVEQTTEDSIKILNLLGMTRLSLGQDPDQASEYAKEVIRIGKNISDDRNVCTAYTFMANIMYIRSETDSAYHFLDKAYQYAMKAKDSLRAFNCLQNKAVILHSNSQLDEAVSITKSNLENFGILGDSLQMANAILLLGSIYSDKGYVNLALDNFFKALKIYESKKHKYLMAEAYFQIGSLDSESQNLDTSNKFLQKAITLYEATNKQHRKAQAMMSLGQNYIQVKDYPSAKNELEAAFELTKQIGYHDQSNKIKILLARVYSHQDQQKEATKLVEESIVFFEKGEDYFNKIEALFALADIKYENKVYEEAERIYKEATSLSEDKLYPIFLDRGYDHLSKLAERRGNYKSALNYLVKLGHLKDSLSVIDQKKQIDELHLIYETEKKEVYLKMKEAEITVLSQKVQNVNMKKLLFGMAFFMSIVSLFFIHHWYRQKLIHQEKEQTQKNLIHNQELNYKVSELTNQALHLVQKNSLLEKLTQRLQFIQDTDGDIRQESSKLLSSLKIEAELNKDWEQFQDYFLQVHGNFDNKLLELNPKLNENDLRLAYLIKTKLNTHEIASSLHVLPESIRKSKYRLKKKLNIPKEQDLIEFIMHV